MGTEEILTSNLNAIKNRNTFSSTSTTTAIVSIAVIFLLAFFPATTLRISSAELPQVIVVKPNGYNDTTDIQNALNKCATDGPGCTVQLVKGTYYIDQITVYDFQGRFVGMGQGVTTIQALPNLLPPNPADDVPCSGYLTGTCSGTGRELGTPFLAGMPGPTNPWPALFTFWDGSFSISGMTLTEPSTTPVPTGWYWYDTPIPYTSLIALIEITGLQAFATIDHVTVLGTSGDAAGPNTYNLWNGVNYEGTQMPNGWTNPLTQAIPLSGSYTVTNSVFNYVESGPWMDTLFDATATVCDNTITHSYGSTGFYDAYDSKLTYCNNQISNVELFTGIWAAEGVYEFGTLPSTVHITGNQILQVSQGASGILLADYNTVPTLNAVVSGNVLQIDTSCGCYQPIPGYASIYASDLKSLTVLRNTVTSSPVGTSTPAAPGIYVTTQPNGGPVVVSANTVTGTYAGVWVDYASGVHVTDNVIKNSAEYGIAVTDGSGNTFIMENFVHGSGAYDLYQDASSTGTGNVWFGNICQTSSPPGLC